jgi:hypothetical protein
MTIGIFCETFEQELRTAGDTAAADSLRDYNNLVMRGRYEAAKRHLSTIIRLEPDNKYIAFWKALLSMEED